jgi:hypothetical protein
MNIYEQWEKSLKSTEIVRPRIKPLLTDSHTELPYIFLAESAVNKDTTVVRKGKIIVEKPMIILPPNMPQFDGFDEMGQNKTTVDFLLLRGVSFPSFKYNNRVALLDIYNAKLSKGIDHYKSELQKAEDVHCGLIIGPEDCWQCSIIVFVAMMISRSAEQDLKKLLNNYHKKNKV